MADGSPCRARFESAAIEGDAVRVRGAFDCGHPPAVLTIAPAVVDLFASGHRHLATVADGAHEEAFVLVQARPTLTFSLTFRAGERSSRSSFAAMVWMGIAHILTGYDHLAFVFGLLLMGGTAAALLGAISAFTVAHSITLALAVLHVVSLPPRVVEPAIALSIAYVGVENLIGRGPAKRWRITFPFGLVHGFGFAGALVELDLPSGRLPLALFGFNLGVEIGQLAVVAAVLPLLVWARRSDWFRRRVVPLLAGALVVAGCVWFVWRVAG
jgi:hydrogenase/urease accessory protein HupE